MTLFLLEFLPDYLVHVMLIVGFIGAFLLSIAGSWEFLNKYIAPIRIFSIVLLAIGLYLEGGLAVHNDYVVKTSKLEKDLAIANEISQKANVKIIEKTLTKLQVIKLKGQDTIHYIDREVTKYDPKFSKGQECELPKEFIKAHNDAAEAK